MFGTNDLRDLRVDEYRVKLRSVVRRCLDRGTVVILSTIPPRHAFAAQAAAFAEAARKVAGELSVPLVDYHAEVLSAAPMIGMEQRITSGRFSGTTYRR